MAERYKDCNECLQAGIALEVMRECLATARDFAPEKVKGAGEFEGEFMEEWFEHHVEDGLQLPWEFPFRVRMGELTVWTGIEKSGKSTLLGFVLVGLLEQGERALLASYEVKPVKSLKKLSRQAFGGLLYDKRVLDRIQAQAGRTPEGLSAEEQRVNYTAECRGKALETFGWLSRNLWLYDHVGIGNWRELGDDIRWARRRYGITQYVIDNFMRLGIAKDDYAQQADAITFFTALAMELGIHIHVVVHQNKSEGHKGGAGGKRSVSGAFEIIANAHNIVEVQRDEKKGERVSDLFEKRKISQVSEVEFVNEKRALDLVPDGKFILHAQRDGETQNGSKYLWFLWESQQYADKPPGHSACAPLRFVEHDRRRRAREVEQIELPTNEEMGVKGKDE